MPSGKTDPVIAIPDFIQNLVPGDGEMKTYVVDNEDVGRFVARIIADSRTINKKVMAAGASLSFNEMFGIAEELTGGKPVLKYVRASSSSTFKTSGKLTGARFAGFSGCTHRYDCRDERPGRR